MPFKSEKQRRYMHMAHPDIAHAWEHGKHTSKRNSKRSSRRKSSR